MYLEFHYQNINLIDNDKKYNIIDYYDMLSDIEKAPWIALSEVINNMKDNELEYIFCRPVLDNLNNKLHELAQYIISSYNTPEEKVTGFNNIIYYMLNDKYYNFKDKLILILKCICERFHMIKYSNNKYDYIFVFKNNECIVTNGVVMLYYPGNSIYTAYSGSIIEKKEFINSIS